MFGIIVGTHGKFSEEIIKSCEMICGPQANVRAVTLVPGEDPDDMAKKYEAAIAELDCADGVLFLNDLFGGSPYNAACRLAASNETYGVVAGLSLPMLIEMVSAQLTGGPYDILALMERAAEAGRSGTQLFHASRMEEEADDDL
ncbi:MAG: PTS sugar transporter subunit IIA [Selenomonas noxia]|jgi:PTS system, mannose/fructose/sorbose family, IIA component